jgi:hypothetical protein
VAAVKLGSLIHVTAELGVCMMSSSVVWIVAVVPVLAPNTRTAVGLPFIQSNASGLDCPTLDSVIVTVLANPIALSVSFTNFANLKLGRGLLLFAI